MRSALLEKIQKICHYKLISDCTLTLPHIQCCLEDMMQEMGISAADAPTSGVTPALIRLWFTAPELGHLLIDDNDNDATTIGPYIQEWARSFLNIYPGTRIWTTKMTRWDISTPAYATPECWPTQCWRTRKPNQLFTTTTRARLPLIVIRDGTENVSRPRTQQEIPTTLRRLNSRARIYRASFANHRRLGPSGSTTNRRALTLHMPMSQPLHSRAPPQSLPPEDNTN